MKIGDLSRATGVKVETIRYDEKAGHGQARTGHMKGTAA